MAGIKDIAAECGVSYNTVSDILNRGRAHLYRPETCEQVRQAAARLAYRPNRMARSMRSRHSGVVGFVAANMDPDGTLVAYQVYPFLVGASHVLTEQGMHICLVEGSELSEDVGEGGMPQLLHERFLDGLLVHWGASEHDVARITALGMPVIWWDSGITAPTNCIYRDEDEATRIMLEEAFQRGHRRVGLLVGPGSWAKYQAGKSVHYSFARRIDIYRSMMRDRGEDERVMGGYAPDDLYDWLRESGVTAVVGFGLSGMEAAALQDAAARIGLRIPQDLSVLMDRETRLPARGLVFGGVLYDRYEAGRLAADMMLRALAGKTVPSVSLPVAFTAGDSLAPANIGDRRLMSLS